MLEFLELFDIMYEEFTEAEKKEFFNSFIKRIDIYPQPLENGQILKSIQFRFPVYYQGNEVDMFFSNEEKTVETVALLSRQINVYDMNLNSYPFEMIKSGKKTIELRLFDEKHQRVKIGNRIVFTNTTTGESLNTTIMKMYHFNSFKELYKSLPLLKCGYTVKNIDNSKPSDMEQYYSVEEQNKYGVVGIELCRSK